MRFLFGLVLLSIFGCSMKPVDSQKINGVSFVASGIAIDSSHTKPVASIHANYAAIMPFGFIQDLEHPELFFNSQRQWFGETRAGVKQYIESLRKQNIKIMLKPQIWVSHGAYTGHIDMESEVDWQAFENTYSRFILEFAELAEELQVELFCIGTELDYFIKNRPEYWHNLIETIKEVYKGKLTYAANWDEFKRTPFWNDIDYIGIDAYFPLSDLQTPTIEDCKNGWQIHKPIINKYADSLNKPVLFTEFGYRSVDYTAKEPWKSDRSMTEVNLSAQANATQALFETFWEEPWFSGGFVWKWFHNHDDIGGETNNQFTPQNKPVESIIKSHYQLHN
ncbi:glycoside hydrolase family 113 [Hanstruepera ponticola]|uniref:glycoside hydrolase family 113 n=1 Tax=Hanstruepera ponticola TaxID=2042995 RepID=UPI0013C416C6|nr:glycoside hydrolase TIM-barrel-like domain-containing protein [Hanstruepera ponticola]